MTRGDLVIAAGIADALRHGLSTPGLIPAFPNLTPREREILNLIARGRSNHDIAAGLFLSEKTVRNLVSSILNKLRVGSRAEAVAKARDAGVGEADLTGQEQPGP